MTLKNINNQILIILLVLGVVSTAIFSWFVSNSINQSMIDDMDRKANELISRTAQMFMVSTVKFNEEFTQESDSDKKAEILADWTRTIGAIDRAVTHNFGPEQSRVRLFTDADKLGVRSQGGSETLIESQFERQALNEFARGKNTPYLSISKDKYEIAVPLNSNMHPGCANCHGISTSSNKLLGGVSVSIPLQQANELVSERSFNTIVGLIIAMFLLIGFIYFFLNKNVTKPMTELQDQAGKITNEITLGHVAKDHQVDVSKDDEIGLVATSFNDLLAVIKNMMQDISEHAEQVAGAAQGSEHIASQNKQSAVTQQNNLNHIVRAVEELQSTGELVSKRTEETAQASNDVRASSNNGQSTMKQTLHAIQNLNDEVEKASAVIKELDQRSESIGSIIGTIDGIAEQTNLLALNAAIEAARAGEQGRGFAVVADEVRTLAKRTQEATKEINDLIIQLQNDARLASEVMTQGTEKAQQTLTSAESAKSSLDDITQKVSAISDMNRDIATSATQQSVTVLDINRRLQSASKDTESAVEAAEAIAQESGNLSALSKQMTEITSHK